MELYPLWKHIFHESEIYTKYRPKDYALVCIDVFSRYVWAAAMDKEDSPSTAAAILKIFYHMGKPKILQGDQKIINSFKKELSPYFPGITLIASKTHETNKNAVVERAIRTLKNDLLKYLYVHPFPEISGRFVTEEEYYELDTTTMVLQEVCTLRNNTFHRTIRQKPIDVFYGRTLNRQISQKRSIPNLI
jgi:transposase InsO family protein